MRKTNILVLLLYISLPCLSGAVRGGDITVHQTGNLTCAITLTGYTYLNSAIKFSNGEGVIDFGDGQTTAIGASDVVPTIYFAIGVVQFNLSHTYAQPGFYVVSYLENNLDAGILNVSDSFDIPFAIETGFTLTSSGALNLPAFGTIPIFYCTLGKTYSFSTGVVDSHFQYRYTLSPPTAPGKYFIPATLSLNIENGLVTWDTQGNDGFQEGAYYFKIQISQYDNKGNRIGYINRGFEVVVLNEKSNLSVVNPVSDVNGRLVVADGPKTTKVVLTDSIGADSLHWDWYFDPVLKNNISFSLRDSISKSRKSKIIEMTLTSTSDIIRINPYTIILRGTSFFDTRSKDVTFLFYTKDEVITGVKDKPEKITAFPNPFSNQLNISGLDSTDAELRVMNSMGQNILHEKVSEQRNIATSSFPPGVYVIQLFQGTTITTIKAIKD